MVKSCRLVAVQTIPALVCLAIISTVRGCGQMPGGQGRAVKFTVSGFTLPSAMAYTEMTAAASQAPQLSRSAAAAMALVRNLVMQAVNDVLEERGRSEGLPGFVVSAILAQLTIQVNYTPLKCDVVHLVVAPANAYMANLENCIILNDIVTALCTANTCTLASPPMMVNPIADENMRISGTVMTINFIMANWTTQMWQSILNRALQSLRRGAFGRHFATASVTVI